MRRLLRFASRTLLVLLLAVASLYAWRVYSRSQPDTDWQQAQAALVAGDRNAAVVHLRKVVQKNPNHGEAYLTVSQLVLEHARLNGKPTTYAENDRAFTFLKQAGRLLPQNVKLQQQLLALHLDKQAIPEAIEVADRLAKELPNDPDVLTAMAHRAVAQYERSTAEIERLVAAGEAAHFQALSIRAKLDIAAENDGHLQKLLDEALERAVQEGRNRLALLQPREREAMASLLQTAVHKSPDAATAARRLDSALLAWEEAVQVDGKVAARLQIMRTSADEATRLTVLHARQFASGDVAFAARAEAVRQAALAADAASTSARLSSVRWAYDHGDSLRAAETAAQGIPLAKSRAEEFELRMTAARLFVAIRSDRADAEVKALLADREWRGWGHMLAGDQAMLAGRPTAALDHYRAVLPLLGHTREVRAALADAYLAVGRWNEAQAELAGLARRSPTTEVVPTAESTMGELPHRPLLLKLFETYRDHTSHTTAPPATAAL